MSQSSSSPGVGAVGSEASSTTPSMVAGTKSSGGSYAPGPLMVSKRGSPRERICAAGATAAAFSEALAQS